MEALGSHGRERRKSKGLRSSKNMAVAGQAENFLDMSHYVTRCQTYLTA